MGVMTKRTKEAAAHGAKAGNVIPTRVRVLRGRAEIVVKGAHEIRGGATAAVVEVAAGDRGHAPGRRASRAREADVPAHDVGFEKGNG